VSKRAKEKRRGKKRNAAAVLVGEKKKKYALWMKCTYRQLQEDHGKL
jgi:hypothetical protein